MNQHSMPTMSDDPISPLEDAVYGAQPGTDQAPIRKRPKPGERRNQILQTLASMLEQPAGDRITTAALATRLDVSEAARTMGLPEGTVKARLSRARALLRRRFPHLEAEHASMGMEALQAGKEA